MVGLVLVVLGRSSCRMPVPGLGPSSTRGHPPISSRWSGSRPPNKFLPPTGVKLSMILLPMRAFGDLDSASTSHNLRFLWHCLKFFSGRSPRLGAGPCAHQTALKLHVRPVVGVLDLPLTVSRFLLHHIRHHRLRQDQDLGLKFERLPPENQKLQHSWFTIGDLQTAPTPSSTAPGHRRR